MQCSRVHSTDVIVSHRCDHSCAVMKQNMFVCAGTGSDELWFNDLHRLSFDCLEWKEVEMKGAAPQPRDYSTLVSINDWVSPFVYSHGTCTWCCTEGAVQ